jgi:16S rRNA (cytosine1402-N4)-methyltransferase
MADDSPIADRSPDAHTPVLGAALVDQLLPVIRESWVDATTGLGGHAAMFLEATPDSARLIAIDVDPRNLAIAQTRLAAHAGRIAFEADSFRRLPDVLKRVDLPRVDAILADLGIASNQLDNPDIGLSFDRDGPLDMRLDPALDVTAADLVNDLPEKQLADLIYIESQEPRSRKIAKRIGQARRIARIATTRELAQIVTEAVGGRRGRIHPATRTFMALRMAVNDEGGALDDLLKAAPDLLRPGGRLAIISFHSGEDRRVKLDFRTRARNGQYRLITKRPIVADQNERRANPRSRSAKLRVAERTDLAATRE